MVRTEVSRLPAGPGGPEHLRSEYDAERVGSASAVYSACVSILADGDMPSIRRVERRGVSGSTINRPRYKQILHAAKERRRNHPHRAPADEEPDDLFRQMGEKIARGKWGTFGFWDEPQASLRPEEEREDFALRKRIVELEAIQGRLRKQVLKAVGVAKDRGRTIKRQERRIADLEAEVAYSHLAPLPCRDPPRWTEDDE